MRRRSELAQVLAGLCTGLGLGWLIWGDTPWKEAWTVTPPDRANAVLVVAVETRANLDAVRRAVSPDRILVSTETGFAIKPQRLVVTSLESAGELLTSAGWRDRPLEIVHLGRRVPEGNAADQRLERVAALMNKRTLTRAEAYRLLGSM